MLFDFNGKSLEYFVSVKDYGTKADGITDDAPAIQAALDASQNTGGIIYFPQGTYAVGTQVIFYSNQTLYFENGATLLQKTAIDNILMSRCPANTTGYNGVHDCVIYGGTFDGGNFSTNNTLVAIAHAKNIIFENCTFKNAYGTWHNLEINSSYNIKVIDCDFEGSRKTGANGCLIQIDPMNNTSTYPWDNNMGAIDDTHPKYVEISGCIFHNCTVSPAIGNHSGSIIEFIKIHDNVFDGFTSERGTIIFSAENVDIYDNTFNECTIGINSEGDTYHVYDNRFVSVTTPIAGTTSVEHDNIIIT